MGFLFFVFDNQFCEHVACYTDNVNRDGDGIHKRLNKTRGGVGVEVLWVAYM